MAFSIDADRIEEQYEAMAWQNKHPGSTKFLGPLSREHMKPDALWHAWCFMCQRRLAVGTGEEARDAFFNHECGALERIEWAVRTRRFDDSGLITDLKWLVNLVKESGIYHAMKAQELVEELSE